MPASKATARVPIDLDLDDAFDEPLPYYTLVDLLERPELLEPPPVVLPRVAWEGRVTLVAAPEKSGKSTLLGQGVAAMVAQQEFLGGIPAPGGVFWLALDEPLGDLVRRLRGYGATNGVYVCTERPTLGDLESWIEDQQVGLVVIDTLTEFAAGIVDEANSVMQWQPVLKGLREIAQRSRAAIVLLHHATKATGRYRDSSQIGAGVDAILELFPAENDSTVRRVRARGRVRMGDFTLRFIDPWYHLEEGELPVEIRVYRAIESRPGIGKRQLREAVGGNAKALDEALGDLLRKGAVQDRGDRGGKAYHTTSPVSRAGPGLEASHAPVTLWTHPSRDGVSPSGQGGSRSGHTSGHAPVSPPPIERGAGHSTGEPEGSVASEDAEERLGIELEGPG